MCFKFGAVNSGQESSLEKAKPLAAIPKPYYIPVDVEKRRGFGLPSARDGACGGDALTTELVWQGGREGRGREHSDTALQEVFAPGVLVQSEVHHFWGRGPVLLGSHCCPWLRGLGAPERRAALPGGHALDHPSPGMHAPAARRGTRTQRQGHLSSAQPRDPPPPVFLSLSG